MRHRAFSFQIALVLALLQPFGASYCGSNGVPYSLEILSDGSPVLGCAQPTCMAEPQEDEEDSVFIANTAGQEDGFFREGDRQKKSYTQSYKPKAECPGEFSDFACTKKNQWVGGIDFIDHPRQPLVLQCCTFEGLRFSQDVGVTTISAGEAVTGGEVVRDNRQISFDVIANVRKLVDPDDPKRTYFEVTVRRMNCLPDPPEFEVAYDDDVEPEIQRVLGNATNSAMNMGHENHPHMAQEKKVSKNRPYKRKPKTSSTNNVVSPFVEHHEGEKKSREPFIGSFGATIFNPTAENNKEQETPRAPPRRVHQPYTRRILTPKPRIVHTTTVMPTTHAPPVQVQVEPVTQPTPPPNPFVFAPLPPFPQFGLPQPNLFQFPAPPAPPPFGVPQAPQLAPLPQHQHQFGFFQPPPQPQPQIFGGYGLNNGGGYQQPSYGLQGVQTVQQNQLPEMDVYTRSLLTNPNSPFALQLPTFGAAPPAPQFFAPQQQIQDQQKNLQRVNIQAPQREQSNQPAQLMLQPQPDPNQAPNHDTLGALYRPPPFAALGTTLYNFQSHNG
ncbi:WaRThog (hedgehog-like family) [Caenorhabditis elegans]|uniref:WaRThog (Hedgehog-like family) n=1 Tax=Caenorhabditis elegans TaxID=6239 RepID=O61737_CAEEL|nr:WaRThog (hedgehog-like family) [Caenorhabditis elegans]CCD61773.1 WaRThog (hedgehog-like family) [Caenorhabditis elegans]|eukprot:NP_508298.2 WaRThog (hedgehog-like family) [Caenorhabditis elegans]